MARSGIIVVLFLFVFAGFGQAETQKQRDQREAVQKQLDLRYREVCQKIDGLKSRSLPAKEESRKELSRLLEELAAKQATASRKLSGMYSARSDEWDRSKAEANAAIEDVNTAYTSVSSLLR